MGRGAWQATVHGVVKNQTQLMGRGSPSRSGEPGWREETVSGGVSLGAQSNEGGRVSGAPSDEEGRVCEPSLIGAGSPQAERVSRT